MLMLYDYFRSSASLRVSIALNLKKLAYQSIPVHLLQAGGEQFFASYTTLNPQSLVPTLKNEGAVITQSLAILEYLEETFPALPLLPKDREARAYVRSIAQAIACDIHPLSNLRVLNYLGKQGVHGDDKRRWTHHWLTLGLAALDEKIKKSIWRGTYCYQEQPTFADICLIPQLFSAKRFQLDLSPYPHLLAIEAHCLKNPAFSSALPPLDFK